MEPARQAAWNAVVTLSDDGIVTTDGDGTVLWMNPTAASMLGWHDARQAVGRTLDDAPERVWIDGGDHQAVRMSELVHAAVALPEGRQAALRLPGGLHAHWVHLQATRAGEAQTIVRIRDVTPQVHAEQAAARLQAVLDAGLDAVYVAERGSARLSYVNDGGLHQSGWSRDELAGRSLLELLPLLDLDALRHRPSRGDAPPVVTSTVLRHRDGDLRPVDVALREIGRGDDRGIVAIVRDASERVESQARLQGMVQRERARAAELEAMLAAIGNAVVVCGSDGQVTLVNPAARDIFWGARLQTYDELLAHFVDPDGLAPQLGANVRQGPCELRLKGRAERWVEVSAYPVFGAPEFGVGDVGDPVSATIFLARDVTVTREARRIREAFIGVLSHELRTPVTTILGGSRVLRRRSRLSQSTRAEILLDIEAESERLYRIVEDLLVLARFEDRVPEAVTDEPLLLQRILPALVESERMRWPGYTFVLEVPPILATVQGDRTYLEQVVRNLIGNAAKYSPSDGTIEIRAEPADDEVVVRVLDRGPGFPAAETQRLFEPYYRSPTTQGMAAGVGIGLFVSRLLIEAMGGRIWARGRSDGGSEFGFALRTLSEEE